MPYGFVVPPVLLASVSGNSSGSPYTVADDENTIFLHELKEIGVFGNDYLTPDGTGVRDYIHVVDLAKGPPGFLDCQFQRDWHISSMPSCASQPSSRFALPNRILF